MVLGVCRDAIHRVRPIPRVRPDPNQRFGSRRRHVFRARDHGQGGCDEAVREAVVSADHTDLRV